MPKKTLDREPKRLPAMAFHIYGVDGKILVERVRCCLSFLVKAHITIYN